MITGFFLPDFRLLKNAELPINITGTMLYKGLHKDMTYGNMKNSRPFHKLTNSNIINKVDFRRASNVFLTMFDRLFSSFGTNEKGSNEKGNPSPTVSISHLHQPSTVTTERLASEYSMTKDCASPKILINMPFMASREINFNRTVRVYRETPGVCQICL